MRKFLFVLSFTVFLGFVFIIAYPELFYSCLETLAYLFFQITGKYPK